MAYVALHLGHDYIGYLENLSLNSVVLIHHISPERDFILRVKEKAHRLGAHKIVNMRIETSTVNASRGRRGMPCVELFAYGTAIYKKSDKS